MTATLDWAEHAARQFEPKIPDPYLLDPVGWVQDKVGEHLWSKQREIAESVLTNRRTAVKACHGPGKSFLAARLAAWWIDIHEPGEAFVVSTAPTYPQVHAILWEEIRKAHRKARLDGRVLQSDEWKLADDTLVGYGRKPADTDEHGFQGIHRRYVLVIVDEACGIPSQLFTAAEAITTNADCRILAIGNPDDPSSEFAAVCKPGSGWNTIGISAFDTPNFTGEHVPDELRPMLVDPEWVEDKRRRWGEASPRYVSKVLGEFPEIGEDVLISPKLIEAAQQRTLNDEFEWPILAVDVARYGSDRTTMYERRGRVVRRRGSWSKQATTETTGKIIAAVRDVQPSETRVDEDGIGGAVVDQLAEQGVTVRGMRNGVPATDRQRFMMARDEWWWGLRERFEQGDIDIDPEDEELAAELGSIRYGFTPRGQIRIESKGDMRKRGVASPDHADSVMYAFAEVTDDPDTVTDEDLGYERVSIGPTL